MPAQPAPPQVHQQERQIVAGVDAGDFVVELHGVERRRHAVQHDQVAQVQVAVAEPHEPFVTARVEQGSVLFQARLCRPCQRVDRRGLERRPGRAQRRHVAVDHPADAGRTAMVDAMLGGGVQGRDFPRQGRHGLERQGAASGQAVAQRLAVEAAHRHQPVHRRAGAADCEAARGLARHGHHAAVD